MEEKDLKQIGDLFDGRFEKALPKAFNAAFTQVWEHNLEPALQAIHDKLEQLPTKSYLDDKIANLQGDLTTKLRKEDEKVNRLADILRQKNLISDNDIQELGNLVVFPK
ncbi:MAG: hypothetical protein A3H72_00920 [Candidatus Doudnabacteria bacterium RIFCSPLOWO2_02_FULL_48_8]|uniref:Uncharacterized protein n=1 Tax=Candidatus Doudnabacteria bacterium RIFCSPHIGHO2_01_FULL_46_24 TaxID=1817825 RepID=A0A1F5NTJ6_9BACT|nr:MAG: hypothetical protein A2720_03705 [Candidatus Doudnabacteria bacterium RIFCSPHIGHO2_01_FULL_46_24]OGE95274.1 MAG: hypothetical protein A3H72_00920 [Candidatus Doudnabacteria bacterium RIFCSPLOWO2_02_FULL_48_8]OGE96011.1 MAG: hypothetical protein A3E98_03005 [Candidatus Doudnabacteria bacterium RIFCSPHIGHO2_12_FULL_48_11]